MLGLSIFGDFPIPHRRTAGHLNRQCFNQHGSAAVGIPFRSFAVAQEASRAEAAMQSQFLGLFAELSTGRDVQVLLGSGQALPNLGIVELRESVGGQLKDV